MKALGDPSGDLAQQLLSSEELEEDIIEPWWERHANDVPQDKRTAVPRNKQYGTPPSPLSVPPTMMNASAAAANSASRPSLLYNIAAILCVSNIRLFHISIHSCYLVVGIASLTHIPHGISPHRHCPSCKSTIVKPLGRR